jgi:hypothetical protein
VIAVLLSLLTQADLAERGEKLSARLEEIRGLRFKTPLRFREGGRADYARYVLENAKIVYGEDLPGAGDALKSLGLIPKVLRLDLALTAHAGFGVKVFCHGEECVLLDPKAGDDWVLNKMALGLVDQHHAPKVPATYDARMALSALRMGDAEVVKILVLYGGKVPADLAPRLAKDAREWETSGSKLAGAVVPRVLLRTADFPWRRGALLALAVHAKGGFAELDRAYARPPASTEQALHPEKYLADERPVELDPAPAEKTLAAAGWKTSFRTVLGELGTASVLETHFGREDLSAASAGWAGDALLVAEREGQPAAVLWLTEWDAESDAEEFLTEARRLAAKLTPAESGLAAGAWRKKTSVLFASNLPRDLKDGLAEAAWTSTRRRGPAESRFGD